MAILLVSLIAFPLFLRSVLELAFVAAYSLGFWEKQTPAGAVAETFFYWFCIVLVFAGIVAIAFYLAKDVPEHAPILYAPQQAMMSGANLGANGANDMPVNGGQSYGHPSYVQEWGKQPQHQVSPYYEQNGMANGLGASPYQEQNGMAHGGGVLPYHEPNGMTNGGGQAPSCPTCGDSRVIT